MHKTNAPREGTSTSGPFDYVVVGAGPAGLQMGYFLERQGRSYVILEASDCPGAFFRTQPRHRFLLSINKRFNYFNEPDYNLRHDWNSLLSDDPQLLFREYSNDLFPQADDLVRYLRDYAARFSLKVRYNTRVAKVRRDAAERHPIEVTDDRGQVYRARALLMATGAVKEKVPEDIEGIELAESYGRHPIDPKHYENKRVAIIGRGNSAFEVANHLAGSAAYLHLFVGSGVKHAWQTHYVGDLRAINNTVIDMYQLKSLHATLGFVAKKIEQTASGSLRVTLHEELPHWKKPVLATTTMEYDHVIYCTGWRYVEPGLFEPSCTPKSTANGKYPELSATWESSVPDIFYIGAPMAARDRKSASGFIHGFRYNVRTLFHLLEERYHASELPGHTFQDTRVEALADHLIQRLSTVSALYQMNGFLGDVLTFDGDSARLLYELPLSHVTSGASPWMSGRSVTISLEYGFDAYPPTGQSIDFVHPADAFDRSCSAFLHPILRHYEEGQLIEEAHLGESLLVRYDRYDYEENAQAAHKNVIVNFLNRVLGRAVPSLPEEPFPVEVVDQVLSEMPDETLRAARRSGHQPSCLRRPRGMEEAS